MHGIKPYAAFLKTAYLVGNLEMVNGGKGKVVSIEKFLFTVLKTVRFKGIFTKQESAIEDRQTNRGRVITRYPKK